MFPILYNVSLKSLINISEQHYSSGSFDSFEGLRLILCPFLFTSFLEWSFLIALEIFDLTIFIVSYIQIYLRESLRETKLKIYLELKFAIKYTIILE